MPDYGGADTLPCTGHLDCFPRSCLFYPGAGWEEREKVAKAIVAFLRYRPLKDIIMIESHNDLIVMEVHFMIT